MEVAVLARWLAAVAALWTAGLPVAALAFPRDRDRGAAFALPAALVLVAVPAYWVGRVDATAGLLAGGAVLVGAGVAATRRSSFTPRGALARARGPVLLFAVAFALMLGIHLGSPGIVPAGGEKFLDFGLLNAVLRADALPPEDPWFAGRPVRYYWGGHLAIAAVARLAAVDAGYAFTLARATFWAALATAAYGLAARLAAADGAGYRRGGLAGAVLVAAAGPLATPLRLLAGALPPDLVTRFGRALFRGLRAEYAVAVAEATDLVAWRPWFARYVVPDVPTVFPMWTFVNGDLRPHMLSAPFLVLVAAVGLAYCRTPAARRRRRRALCLALGVLSGWLALVNTWSFPVAVGLAALAVWLADSDPATLAPQWLARLLGPTDRTVVDEPRRLVLALATAAVVAGLGAAIAAPLLVRSPPTRGVGLLPPGSGAVPLALVYGGLLVPIGLDLVARAWPVLSPASPSRHRRPRAVPGDPVPVLAVAGVAGIATVLGLLAGVDAAALFVPPALLAWFLRRRGRAGYGAVLVVAGCGLVLVAEVAYLRVYPFDPNAPRWNTVYKVSHAAWILLGTAAGGAVAGVLDRLRLRLGPAEDDGPTAPRPSLPVPAPDRIARGAAAALVVLALLAGGSFGAMATAERAAYYDAPALAVVAGGTLDASAYARANHSDAAAAIAWLDRRPGTPTLASAPGAGPPTPTYTWVSAPSSYTGLPTVAGWRHERGYRDDAAYERRVRALRTLYEGPAAAARRTIDRYGVDYVYVGRAERKRYDLADPARVEGVRPVVRAGNVTVYAVTDG